VFIDNTIIEVFANDRQAICRRVYPDREDSTGVVLFSEGGKAFFDDIQAWRMAPSNPY
jgi:beta-fructofuranosidase